MLPLSLTLFACASGGRGTGSLDADSAGSDGSLSDASADVRRDLLTTVRDAGRDLFALDVPQDSSPEAAADASGAEAGVDSGAIDAGRADVRVDAGATCSPTAGALAIVEAMISSRSGSGDRGEWFEVLNVTDCAVELTGVMIVSPSGTGEEKSHSVASGRISAGESFVLALSANPVDNHNLTHDYAYGARTAADVILNNSADWIELRFGGAVIDRVAWPSSGFTHGRARQLSSTAPPSSNGDWSRWCDSTATYSASVGGPFLGSPGMANAPCR